MSATAQSHIHRAALKLFGERGATQISVTDLAQAAGVARGTIYNNLDDLAGLFDLVALELALAISARVVRSIATGDEPVGRLAAGIRLYILSATRDPEIGRFLIRFGLSAAALRQLWTGQPLADLIAGRAQGSYDFTDDQLDAVVAFISGAAIGAIAHTLERPELSAEAGMDAAERVLVALGVPRADAREHARAPLPPDPAEAP
ncbi:AcrR family transcriptional regulator [Rhodoblastus sphagnicola]|uniref:TetR/AcrR family transcriptional regulator n=1 Tax=Rhodoblastus sphagnicola TaxID=333368 RepID=UPI0017934815|nr:TetR family transcriptional regulator [Rhodoblastus sphagnicola]MBB4197855.1 AcrR family transcriptional regulator [Rhodoblastus sphagnicola]